MAREAKPLAAPLGLGFGLTALAGSVVAYAATFAVWTLGEIVTAGLGAAIVAGLARAPMPSGCWPSARRLGAARGLR